jgi:anti-sigma-K factor RskA
MSGTDTEDPGPEATLAAEYVLGTLEQAEADAARARIGAEPAFAAEVRFWEAKLTPLLALVPVVQPPTSLWSRIEDSTGGAQNAAANLRQAPPANDNGLAWWRATALAGLAVAAALAAYIVLGRPPPPPPTPGGHTLERGCALDP